MQGQGGLYGQGTVSGIGARQGDLFVPGDVSAPTPMPADAGRFGLTAADVQMAAAYSDGEPTAAFAYGVKRRREGKAQPITSDDQEQFAPAQQRQARDGYRAADQFASNLTQAARERAEQRGGRNGVGYRFRGRNGVGYRFSGTQDRNGVGCRVGGSGSACCRWSPSPGE